MLIELNRFLTADQVKTLYQFPDDLFEKVQPFLPVAHVSVDGTPRYQEMIVDEFLQYIGKHWNFSEATTDELEQAVSIVAGGEPKLTEMVWPDHVRIDGIEYGPFGPLEARFLDALVGNGAVTVDDVCEHMWGSGAFPTDNALRKHVERINQKLADQDSSQFIDPSNGYFVLR